MRRIVLLLMSMALAATACGDDGSALTTTAVTTAPATTATSAPPSTTAAPPPPPSTPVTTTLPPTTTTAAPTTTTAITTTTTATTVPAGGPYLVDEGNFFPDPYPGSLDAHGSGCVTGGTGLLPDGVWLGYAETLSSGTIGFDLVCFYSWPVADAKAAEDGVVAIDFYVRNLNPNTYPVPVATTARVWYIDMTSGNPGIPDEIPLAAWPHPGSYVPYPCDYCPVWLYVNDGEATGIVEQYLP